MDSRTDNLVVTEEANVDEDIPIGIKKEQITESYKEKSAKGLPPLRRTKLSKGAQEKKNEF